MIIDDYIVSEDNTIFETLDVINKNASKTAFVCANRKLLGAVSDGDIRRAIISGKGMDTKVRDIANYKPVYLPFSRKHEADRLIRNKQINAIPILDNDGNIVDIQVLLKGRIHRGNKLNIPVVIMAGGKGTRLKPYTDILPKPLIPIGEKTITEHIIDRFFNAGCDEFYMIVNYKKEFIKAYFLDNSDGVSTIVPQFIEEKEFLGTGGGISLLTGKVNSPFFLTNCDIIVEADYEEILHAHKAANNIITMVCARKSIEIPYGTIEINELGQVEAIKEKPVYNMLTNTGVYIIEPQFLNKVPVNTRIDITDIIGNCIKDGEKVGTYLIDDSDWMDMGQLEELEKMKEKMGF